MTKEVTEALKRLESNADALRIIPASEQYIGHAQMVICAAIRDTKIAIEAVAKENDDRWNATGKLFPQV